MLEMEETDKPEKVKGLNKWKNQMERKEVLRMVQGERVPKM